MSFYTSKGDDGTTNILGEGRVAKYHARIEAVGTLDESTAALGLARAQCMDPHSGTILLQAQRDYFGAHTYERVDKPGTFHTEWAHPQK